MEIDYEPKQIVASIGGREYPVAPRTEKIERTLRELEAGSGSVSQYESDMKTVQTLLGEKAAAELFPLGEDENLDRLYAIAVKLLGAYRANYTELASESAKDQMDPILEQLKELSNNIKPLLEFSQKMASKPNRKK